MNMAKLLVILLVIVLPGVVWAQSGTYAVGIGFEYYNGDYGTSEETDSYSIPLTFNYYPTQRWDFQLKIPYVYVSSSSTLLIIRREPVVAAPEVAAAELGREPAWGLEQVPRPRLWLSTPWPMKQSPLSIPVTARVGWEMLF